MPPWSHTISNFKNAVTSPRCCFIVGATGLVGGHLLNTILSSNAFDRVLVIARRSTGYTGPNKDILDERIIEDFDQLIMAAEGGQTDYESIFEGIQYGFISLGSTRRKAGSAEAFRHIDHDYILAIGQLAKKASIKWLGLVSSTGADSRSTFLYPRVKGETENDLIDLKMAHLSIFRPGLLVGQREDVRVVEMMGQWMAPILNFLTGGRMAIEAEQVAKVMFNDLMETVVAESHGDTQPTVKIISNQAMLDTIKFTSQI